MKSCKALNQPVVQYTLHIYAMGFCSPNISRTFLIVLSSCILLLLKYQNTITKNRLKANTKIYLHIQRDNVESCICYLGLRSVNMLYVGPDKQTVA